MLRVLLPIFFWLICRFPTGRGKITRGQRGFFLLLLLIIELLYQAGQIQRMICIKNVKKMSENAPKSHSSSVSSLPVSLCFGGLMSCQVHLCSFLPVPPPLRHALSWFSSPLPGERCPDLSREGSVPIRPELHARRLFKVIDCFVPESPLEHAAASPPLLKKSYMFYTDQTPSHPHKAYHRSTREIIEELPQGNVRIIA